MIAANAGDSPGSLGILAPSAQPGPIRMSYCHRHNLVDPGRADADRRFGIRVTLPSTDTLRTVIGDDWERLHWYATAAERDRAYESMARRHGYYRKSDTPAQVLEKVER
jgi:hypothetical protein